MYKKYKFAIAKPHISDIYPGNKLSGPYFIYETKNNYIWLVEFKNMSNIFSNIEDCIYIWSKYDMHSSNNKFWDIIEK